MTDATWRERIAAKHAAEVAVVEAALTVVTAALRDAVSGRDSDSEPSTAVCRAKQGSVRLSGRSGQCAAAGATMNEATQ